LDGCASHLPDGSHSAAILLIVGAFSAFAVLGVWMLPLGLVLFAQDVPMLQKPDREDA